MVQVFWKEINAFYSSLIGYFVTGIFLVILGLIIWVFPDYSLLYFNYATLDQLFVIAPVVFMFLIPAITMRSFSEEFQNGTIEFLMTKPLTEWQIVTGKFLANWMLVIISLIPTLLYYYTVYELGSPKGNLDSGAIMGSYIGLIFLAGSFVSIGVFASSLNKNQIVAFLLAALMCMTFHWGFTLLSKMPVFFGYWDDIILNFGIDWHYTSISRGVLDSRDILYFISIMIIFNSLSIISLKSKKW